ncbi:hypothetical protein [Paenibacillus sp. USHLN196]|uniref:hypothetical protein n=1 Tax=Paenibacillus sp. USHLN196 TaxID=3081291 RepID=UPI00301A1626
MLKYKIWNCSEDRFLTEDESYRFGIGIDGKLYEFDCGAADGSAWLERDICSDYYEIHFDDKS